MHRVELLFSGSRLVLNTGGDDGTDCVYFDRLADGSIMVRCEQSERDADDVQEHQIFAEHVEALQAWLKR